MTHFNGDDSQFSSGHEPVLRYSCVWEDGEVLLKALGSAAMQGRILSIGSAGDNTLLLLTLDPAEVIAVDSNHAQLACLELKMVAFENMDDKNLKAFLGIDKSASRVQAYRQFRSNLSERTRSFWDKHSDYIERGIIHFGRLEQHLQWFRKIILPFIHHQGILDDAIVARDETEREFFYDHHWNTLRWRTFFLLFFNKFILKQFARDPSFFRYSAAPVARTLLNRIRRAFTALPVHSNPYLRYALTGNFAPDALPPYLQTHNIERIRSRLSRINLVAGVIPDALAGHFHGFNLSNIFEYMSDSQFVACYDNLVRHSIPHARLVYWNLFIDRHTPAIAQGWVRNLTTLSQDLHEQDRVVTYGSVYVDEVVAVPSEV